MDLSGKTVLITGASRGIGEASVAEFVAAGAKVVLTARSKAEIDRIAAPFGDQALAIEGDIADPAFVTALIDQTVAHFGGAGCCHQQCRGPASHCTGRGCGHRRMVQIDRH